LPAQAYVTGPHVERLASSSSKVCLVCFPLFLKIWDEKKTVAELEAVRPGESRSSSSSRRDDDDSIDCLS
jgi:hypothetical protein